jgi:hypothetical protein
MNLLLLNFYLKIIKIDESVFLNKNFYSDYKKKKNENLLIVNKNNLFIL